MSPKAQNEELPIDQSENSLNTTEEEKDVVPDSLINYNDALEYWKSVAPTVDGVLGGFGENTVVPLRDVAGSHSFLRKLSSRMRPNKDEIKYGFELGAGIGRISKNVLSKYCDQIDLLEYNPYFVDQMASELSELYDQKKIGDVFTVGMQDFHTVYKPERKYWLVWAQWCLNYLPDTELVAFLLLIRKQLSPNGTVIVKENICVNIYDEDIFDDVDSSVTRTDTKFKKIFADAGFKLIAQDTQKGLPKELYPVKMYAIKPDPSAR